jgi:hypothetical protein
MNVSLAFWRSKANQWTRVCEQCGINNGLEVFTSLQTTDPMAITLTLKDKYPDWTQEDWDRFRWINSWDRRRRNLAPLLPCKRCGTAAIFEENHEDMPYHNVFTLGCPKCRRYLETTTDLSPVQFWGGFGNQKCTFSVVQNRVPLHMVRQWNYVNSPVAQRYSVTSDRRPSVSRRNSPNRTQRHR